MLSACSIGLLAITDNLLGSKTLESLTFFSVPPVVYMPLAAIAVSILLAYSLARWMRLKDFGWKFSLILAAWTASIAVVLFGHFKLGADLRGGVNLVYEVDEEKTRLLNPTGKPNDYQLTAVVDVLRRRLNPSGVRELVIRKSGPKQIEVVVPEVDKGQIDDIKMRIIKGGALRFLIVANDEIKDGQIIEAAKTQAANPERAKNLTVVDDDGKVIGIWTKLARDTDSPDGAFKHTPMSGDLIRDARTGALITLLPEEKAELAESPAKLSGGVLSKLLAKRGIKDVDVLLRAPDRPELDVRGEDLAYASPELNVNGWQINFTMKGEGIGKMSALTGLNLPPPDRYLAIVFDNELISAPAIRGHISDHGQITGTFTEDEVRFMAELLKSGSMPVVLFETPIAENLIGSILGQDTIIKGSWSVVGSLLVVLVVVGLYYRFAGFIACLALVLNLLLTVAIMMLIQAPFTLPGLAGLVLTVGMSIDANVLIYERLREETARGAAFRMALRNGFDRAMATIIDSNLTTLLTAVVLYVIGTDQLKGFGVTVSLGIITSMFTAVFCARVIFEAGERARWLKSLSMIHFLTNPKVDWVKLFIPTTVASAVLILIGLIATVARGTGIFDIDLKGGTTVTAMLREKMTDAEVRSALSKEFANVVDQETKGHVDWQVYEISIQGEQPGTVYKIDSSLQKVAVLQDHVQHALKDPKTGKEGVRTYELEYKLLGSSAPDASSQGATPAEKPPADRGNKSGPAPKETKSGQEGATPKEKGTPEGSPDCGSTDDTAKGGGQEDPAKGATSNKTENSKTEPAKDVKGSASAETSDKEKPAPAEAKSAEKAAPGKTKAPPPPPFPAQGSTPASQPAPAAAAQQTTFEVHFPKNKISAYALVQHIHESAERTIKLTPTVEVSNPDWDTRDNSAFEKWEVKLGLGEADARRVMADLEKTMESSAVWQNASSVSGQVTLDMQLKALYAILVSLLGIAAYVWFRFQKLSWGIAAIVSLIHDTLVMLAGIALSYWLAPLLGFLLIDEFKISLTVVAGFLTLIGYSINDTIVIFDRIREIRGKSSHISGQMINDSVNQTLSRTILTGGLTLLVVVILYIWGGEGIHTFAFCMLIGVISGTYSTVFIAAPLLLWLLGKEVTASQPAKTTPVKQPVATGSRT